MGTDPYQPLTLISDFEKSRFYVLSVNLSGLEVLRISPDLEWAMIVAYNRGKMESVRGTALYERYAEMMKGCDMVIGSIADDRMFYVLDNFFLGNITDKALVMSLSALQPGEQYVAVTEKACSRIQVVAEHLDSPYNKLHGWKHSIRRGCFFLPAHMRFSLKIEKLRDAP